MDVLPITVVIVTYNRGRPLVDTITSVLSQSPLASETIVVDQTQKHDEIVDRRLQQWHQEGKIRYERQKIPNAQVARNRAIALATMPVILFIDDDVLLEPGLIRAHYENYLDPNLCAVCGYYTEPGDVPVFELPREAQDRWTGWTRFPHSYTQRTECHLIPTCNGSIRTNVIRSLGGFDENFVYTLLDDTDLACRFKAAGYKGVHDPTAKLIHLKEKAGGNRPKGINNYVLAKSSVWYTWFYFYLMNFGVRGLPDLYRNCRRTVLRRSNIIRPWFLAIAIMECCTGGMLAAIAMLRGRKLRKFEELGEQ